MSESKVPAIRPRMKYVLVELEKREATPSGLVVPDTARGYDVIVVRAKGPDVRADLEVGMAVMLYPGGRTLITFDESPNFALVEDDSIMCIDDRDVAELLAAQPKVLHGPDGSVLQ